MSPEGDYPAAHLSLLDSLAHSRGNSPAVDSVMWHVYKKGIDDMCIPVKPVDCEV